ncbi:BAIP2 protein, partial [Atractosteus spatula]|nr:BAIP2 protein [Atractosteus spatula]
MGKQYEKALTRVTNIAKDYFDTLGKLGKLASDSQGLKELGKRGRSRGQGQGWGRAAQ